MREVIVIGAGVSGLVAAHALRCAGLDVCVLERAGGTGGRVRTTRHGGFLMEHGPNCVVAPAPELERLVAKLGIAGERVDRGERVRNRYLVRKGRMRRLPIAPTGFLLSGYLPPAALLRLAREPFVPPVAADETVAGFVTRRFGREVLDALIDPLVGGLYAGDPARLGVAAVFPQLKQLELAHGSVLRGILRTRRACPGSANHPANRTLYSFREGLGTLPAALADALRGRIFCGVQVEAIQPAHGRFSLRVREGAERRTIHAASIVLAVSAPTAAALLAPLEGGVATELGAVAHPSVSVVYLGYPARAVPHPLDGLGVLAPSRERRAVLGMLFSSTLFPGRAPDGHVALTAYVGGARDPALARLPEPDLVDLVHGEAQALLGVVHRPVLAQTRCWRTGLPQPRPGHAALIESLRGLERAVPGLFITGNYLGGVSVAQCVAGACATAQRLIEAARAVPAAAA